MTNDYVFLRFFERLHTFSRTLLMKRTWRAWPFSRWCDQQTLLTSTITNKPQHPLRLW